MKSLFFLKAFGLCGALFLFFNQNISSQDTKEVDKTIPTQLSIVLGASRLSVYLPLLKGKRVGLVVNHTATVHKTHLVDTLMALGVQVEVVFAPEHGFRGDADAGETVKNGKDLKTGLPLISLYGKNKKPTPEQLENLDILVFDIQDVGARFYTYISTMHYVMEACAENNKKILVLDRPNPNGKFIDGCILDKKFSSFVGLHPIPVLHGLTVGELAKMIIGEKWLKNGVVCDLAVVSMENYTHATPYELPIKPSPNLPNGQAVRLYASLCLFEGTPISVGRGTMFPFQMVGFPDTLMGTFDFTPKSIEGMAKDPLHKNQVCYGLDLRESVDEGLQLKFLIAFYSKFANKKVFFNQFFDKLAGTDLLRKQIQAGKSEAFIKKSWQKGLKNYQKIRQKYVLYP